MALNRRGRRTSTPAQIIMHRPAFIGSTRESRRAVATGDTLTAGEDGVTEEDIKALLSGRKASIHRPANANVSSDAASSAELGSVGSEAPGGGETHRRAARPLPK